jgi:hypothetical protein
MQNSTAIKTKSTALTVETTALPWTFMFLVIVCAGVVAAGFFFAARQHFTSMEYGIKNSRLREQLQNLETEKRRLLLAREVATSPIAIRKAVRGMGLQQSSEVTAVVAKQRSAPENKVFSTPDVIKTADGRSAERLPIIRTSLARPVEVKSTGESRSRVVEPSKNKKEKSEIAALLKVK